MRYARAALNRRRRFIPGTPRIRRRYIAGRRLNRFFTRYARNYLSFQRRLRMSSLQSILYYNRLSPALQRRIRIRYYRTGNSRLFRMQGRRPRLRHMRTDY